MRRSAQYYERERQKGRTISAVLHFLFLIVMIFGLPSFLSPEPPPEEPVAITVELLPITEISNVKPADKPPAPEKKPEEKKPEQAKPSPPVKTADATPPPPPEPKIAEVKKEEKKPEEKKPEPKKEEKKKVKLEDLDAVLKAVKETAQKENKDDKKEKKDSGAPNKSISNNYNPNLPMSLSEKDAIMGQLARCWNVPAGAKDAQNLVVVIDAEYNNDGSYTKVTLAKESLLRYNSDSFFRAAADSAIRAVKQCSPLKNLPLEKYDTWRAMELRFDPKYMLN